MLSQVVRFLMFSFLFENRREGVLAVLVRPCRDTTQVSYPSLSNVLTTSPPTKPVPPAITTRPAPAMVGDVDYDNKMSEDAT